MNSSMQTSQVANIVIHLIPLQIPKFTVLPNSARDRHRLLSKGITNYLWADLVFSYPTPLQPWLSIPTRLLDDYSR